MLPDDLDLSGWDLRKALGLARKSNPPLIEWLRSPVVYHEEPWSMGRFREAVAACYSPERCFRHYLSMAKGNERDYLHGEEVWLKKYLYVLRPLLACRWIEATPAVPVPMEFGRLLDATVPPGPLRDAIEGLVAEKISGQELSRGPRRLEISAFLESELPRLDTVVPPGGELPPAEPLDACFREIVLRTDGAPLQ